MRLLTLATASLAIFSAAVYARAETPLPPGWSNNICVQAALSAERAYRIPDLLLTAIVAVESRGRPWVLTTLDGDNIHSESAHAAVPHLYRGRKPRTDIAIGCAQISMTWQLQRLDGQPERALDPYANLRYAAEILLEFRRRERSWNAAVARYYSSKPKHGQRYVCDVLDVYATLRHMPMTPAERAHCDAAGAKPTGIVRR